MTSMKSSHSMENRFVSVKNQLLMKKMTSQLKIFPKVTKPERAGIYRDKNDENASKNVTWSLKSHEIVKSMEKHVLNGQNRLLNGKNQLLMKKTTSETKNDPWKTTTFSKS